MPAYRIVVLPSAARELAKLPRTVVRRIATAIDELGDDPRPPGVRKLAGATGDQWRVRIGNYRVLYEIRDGELLVTVVKIARRRQAYRQR